MSHRGKTKLVRELGKDPSHSSTGSSFCPPTVIRYVLRHAPGPTIQCSSVTSEKEKQTFTLAAVRPLSVFLTVKQKHIHLL